MSIDVDHDINIDSTNAKALSGRSLQSACMHYPESKCSFIDPDSEKIFCCRICHDEQVTNGQINFGHEVRLRITEVVCKECQTRQGLS